MKYLHLRFPDGKTKAVTLSYDDGSKHDMRLLETIEKYGLKCTFNLVGSSVAENERTMNNDYIKENIIGKGHEVATHGYFHRAQDLVRPIEGIREVLDSRLALEKAFGMIIRGMAFPDRGISRITRPEVYSRIRSYLSELDIAYCRSLGEDHDSFTLPDDFLCWMPTAHHDDPKIFELIERFMSLDVDKQYCASQGPRLFYLWGHSFEFENKGNWDHLEKICAALSGGENVWYATNIEICEYVRAYQSLVYSADGMTVYNPTLKDLWVSVDKTLWRIGSGETVRF